MGVVIVQCAESGQAKPAAEIATVRFEPPGGEQMQIHFGEKCVHRVRTPLAISRAGTCARIARTHATS